VYGGQTSVHSNSLLFIELCHKEITDHAAVDQSKSSIQQSQVEKKGLTKYSQINKLRLYLCHGVGCTCQSLNSIRERWREKKHDISEHKGQR